MADVPYPLTADNLTDFRTQVLDIFKDLYYQNIGGSMVGDVFTNSSDVFELKINEESGLFKNADNELDFKATANIISNVPSGGISSTTVQGALNELSGDKIQTYGVPSVGYLTIKTGTTGVGAPAAGYGTLCADTGVDPFVGLYIKRSDGSMLQIMYNYFA